ncbi:mannose-1-phosphate guanylyltransferase [Schaalia dentiphila]|jgi:Mannose-1-phosphate guanylyltransferase|uniref:Mannose-1-phosphate guanylyltransferase/mannose-6-phosphate isomerase n=1 Tax=Schaalia dentiphila ATCC 17982 TaxID=411466 RepID=A7BEL3_9ACTO|nr:MULTISPECIES: mannose-1-phosphate guanylyltransferase [Schaalia]EDN81637.1 putative mannose-1-phosphate guanylyltransferase/mannose-6-phosphate isomerase [Schaalia odontolytica ATCC 17982]
MSDLHVIIPAGGAGTRLWPLSRRRRPKFLLDLAGTGRTLLQGTVDRLEESASSVTIVTGQAHRDGVLAQLPEFASSDNRTLLIEPSGRDSMAAIGLAAYVVRERFGDDAIVGSFAADHLIARPELLRIAVETAIGAAREGYVVTIGLTPTEASTAYGYIAPGPALSDEAGEADAECGARRVAEFVEKPDADTAARYVAAGYLWNAGMFIVSAGVLAAHLARLLPDMHARLETVARAWGTPEFDEVLADNWPHLTKIAIDHAIAEPVATDGGVAVVPADAELGWTDLGDFEALTGIVAEAGNLGEALRVESEGAAVFCSLTQDGEGPLVALVGVPDVAVALTPDAILVTRRDRAQSVKAVVDQLADRGRSDLL